MMKRIVSGILAVLLLTSVLLLSGCWSSDPGKNVSRTGRVPDVSEYEALLDKSAWKTYGNVEWIFLNNELYEDYTLIYPYTIEGDKFIIADHFYTFNAIMGTREEQESESVTLPIRFLDDNVMMIGDVTAYRNDKIKVEENPHYNPNFAESVASAANAASMEMRD